MVRRSSAEGYVRRARSLHHRVLVLPWLRRPAQRLIMPRWLAITIGPLILAWRPLDEAELVHELVHVGQWRRYGLRFIPLYFRASADAERAGGHRYRHNVFEIEARAAADAVRARRAAEAEAAAVADGGGS